MFIGRQPILDRAQNIAGYELLFRSSRANFFDQSDAVAATSQVIVSAVLNIGLEKLLAGKPAFINFDRTLLLGDWTTLLPPDTAVIEILETVPVDAEVLAACRRLQEQGYALALDDCLDDDRTAAFAPCVDILKVDFQQLSIASQGNIIDRYRAFKLKLLAEKVETGEEFERAVELGYHYFQGYFFEHPTILQSQNFEPSHLSSLRLVKQVQRAKLDYAAIEELIRQNVWFSDALFKYLNFGAVGAGRSVSSIHEALRLLGDEEIRKWVWMSALSSLSEGRPPVLVPQLLLRGRFCQFIAESSKLPCGASDPFLAGMFSLLGAVLQRPLPETLDDLNIAPNLREALSGPLDVASPISRVLHLVKCYEAANWDVVETLMAGMNLSADQLTAGYLEAAAWVDGVLAAPDRADALPAASFHRDPPPLK